MNYVFSRYYDPEVGRWINADDTDYLGADVSPLSYNLFAYCLNNPVNRFDDSGNWSLPNWAKVVVGAVATVTAVAITVATGGAAAPVLIGVAASTIGGAAISAIKNRVTTGRWDGAGKAATLNNATTYKAMKGYNIVKKVAGQKVANELSLYHNKVFITRMRRLGAIIYDNGPYYSSKATSLWYQMERQVLKGYANYVRMY